MSLEEDGAFNMKKLRWGIIGFGAFADIAMGPAITNTGGHELVAIMGRNKSKIKDFARKYKVEYVYDSAEKLVNNEEIEAVYVATPNFQHCMHTVLAAERGLHVVCEKPMAVTVDEAKRMVSVCRDRGVKLMIGNMMRFNPCHPWLKEKLENDAIGDVTETHAAFEFFLAPEYSQWRVDPDTGGAGIFMDVGVHCVDLMRYLLGSEVTEVSAFMETGDYPFPVDVSSVAIFRFQNGTLGTLNVSFNNRNPVNTLEFRGARGVAICERTLWRESTGSVRIEIEGKTKVFEPELGTLNPYILQIEHFKECIEKDRDPLVSGEEGLKDLQVCLAAYDSADGGQSVNLS